MKTKLVISIIGDLINAKGGTANEKVLARDELAYFNPDVINDNIGKLIEAALEAASKDGKHLGDYIDCQMTINLSGDERPALNLNSKTIQVLAAHNISLDFDPYC